MSRTNTSWHVTAEHSGQTLSSLVRARLGVSWSRAKKHVTAGKVFVDDVCQTDVALRLAVGQTVELRMHAARPRVPGPTVTIAYEDRHVVVIDKPSGVSSVPYMGRESNTAMDLLRALWRRQRSDRSQVPLHVVHRIDKATSGLLMFAKSKRAELGLAGQFRAHSVDREYLCVAHGRASSGRIESRLVRDRGDGLRGRSRRRGQGKRAVTHVQVAEHLTGGHGQQVLASACRVRLETGKTHQIRIHLAESGHPLVGEAVYIRDFLAAGRAPLTSGRLLLHAHTLGFTHPISDRPVALRSPLPDDFSSVLERLGSSASAFSDKRITEIRADRADHPDR